MSRIYKGSENIIFDNIQRNAFIDNVDRNTRKINIDGMKMNKHIWYNLPRDILEQKYKLNEMGKLKYIKDTSVKSEYELLNKYNEPYENGRDTLLWDTCNKYDINVSGYNINNKYVKRRYNALSDRLMIA